MAPSSSRGSQNRAAVEDTPLWHLLPFAVFVAVNASIWYFNFDRLRVLQDRLNPFTVVLLSLATYRLANIVSNEQVMKPVRAPFVEVEETADGRDKEIPVQRKGLATTLGTLLYCPSCVGVWAAALHVYLWIFVPTAGWVVTTIFALSAGERILTNAVAALDKCGR